MSTVPVNTASLGVDSAGCCAGIKIFEQYQDQVYATSFPESLMVVIETLRNKNLNKLTLQVDLPEGEARWLADLVLQKLCDIEIDWDTLEVIMPSEVLTHNQEEDEKYAADMAENKEGVTHRVLAHVADRCVVYKGAPQNVPWPWLDLTKLSRFGCCSLQLQEEVTWIQFGALVRNANLDNTPIELQLQVNGVVPCDGAGDLDETVCDSSRIQKLDLGLVEQSIKLKSLLLIGNVPVYQGLTVLKAQVMNSESPRGIYSALKLCKHLENFEIKCDTNQVSSIRNAYKDGVMEAKGNLVDNLKCAEITARINGSER